MLVNWLLNCLGKELSCFQHQMHPSFLLSCWKFLGGDNTSLWRSHIYWLSLFLCFLPAATTYLWIIQLLITMLMTISPNSHNEISPSLLSLVWIREAWTWQSVMREGVGVCRNSILQIPSLLYMINASSMRLVNGLEIKRLPIPIPPLHLCCVFGRLMEVNQFIVGHSDCTRILQAKRYAIVLCWLTPHASSFVLLIFHMDGMRVLLLSLLQVRLTCVKRSLACIL